MIFEELGFRDDTYVCLNSNGSKLFSYLDSNFVSFINQYNVEEYRIPTLIDREVLRKCGYFDSFPQHLTVPAHINERNFNEVVKEKGVKNEFLAGANKYLTPAACLHIYPMLEGKTFDKPLVITTKARVYRFEGGKFEDITRLWDFNVRELVFVGNAKYVRDSLGDLMNKALEFAKHITDQAYIESASDNFYPSAKNKVKQRIQKSNSLKNELIIPINGKKVAVASFNFHEYHFSKPFNFDNNGEIVTGCVGFGMERWIAACLEYNFSI